MPYQLAQSMTLAIGERLDFFKVEDLFSERVRRRFKVNSSEWICSVLSAAKFNNTTIQSTSIGNSLDPYPQRRAQAADNNQIYIRDLDLAR